MHLLHLLILIYFYDHHAISEALERLLFKRFKNEAASQISEVFNITCKNEDSITEKEIKILSELATEYEIKKQV